MTISVSNASLNDTGTPSSPRTQAYASNNTANNGLIVAVTIDATATLNTPTDTRGNTFTLVGSKAGTNFQVKVWFVKQCAAGANTVSVSYTGTATFASLGISEISDSGGNASGFNIDQTGTATSATNTISLTTSATTVANELVYGAMVTDGTPTAGSGYTTLNAGTATGRKEEYKTVTSTGTQTINFTMTSASESEMVGATFYTASSLFANSGAIIFI